MKLSIKRNVLHIKNKSGKITRHILKSITIFFDWTYFKKLEIKILKPKKIYLKNPVQFYNSKFIGELLPGCGRKKNKLTWKYKLCFFNLEFEYNKIIIVRKSEYRKILKKKGLL